MSEAVPQAVGIDVGGTKVVALRVTGEGEELARAVRPTPADDMEATLRTLVAVIDRGIEKVDARAQSSDDGLDVGLIRGIIRLAEIGTEPNGREPQIASAGYLLRPPEVSD